jgi:predicted small integral membrane protein
MENIFKLNCANKIMQVKEVVGKNKLLGKSEEKAERKVKISHRFVTALSVVSILGFAGIISETLVEFDANYYIESLLMFVIGIGLILEAKSKNLKSLTHGLDKNNFTHLTTVVIGCIALIAGIFSFPGIRIEAAGFLAVKGIISIIAIVVIIIQTWFVD